MFSTIAYYITIIYPDPLKLNAWNILQPYMNFREHLTLPEFSVITS